MSKTPEQNAELAARYDAIYGRDTDGSAFADQPLAVPVEKVAGDVPIVPSDAVKVSPPC